MTDQQINVEIAWALGFCIELSVLQSGLDIVLGNKRKPLPDYCNDLNAMRHVETFGALDLQKYGNALRDSIKPSGFVDYCEDYIWHASARQRAEAFLRTVGRWEEAK